jgi:hypothetical protein
MLRVSNTIATVSLLFLLQSLAAPEAARSADGVERHLVLTNNSHKIIVEVHVADDHTDNWEDDVLGPEFLHPGGFERVDIDEDQNGNCFVDVEAIFDSGMIRTYRRVNVCYENAKMQLQ